MGWTGVYNLFSNRERHEKHDFFWGGVMLIRRDYKRTYPLHLYGVRERSSRFAIVVNPSYSITPAGATQSKGTTTVHVPNAPHELFVFLEKYTEFYVVKKNHKLSLEVMETP